MYNSVCVCVCVGVSCVGVCVCLYIWSICFRDSQAIEKPSVLTVNPKVHLDSVTWQKISNNKHPSVSLSLSYILTNLPTTTEALQWMCWQSAKRLEIWMCMYACAHAYLAPWASMWAWKFVFVYAWVSPLSYNNAIIFPILHCTELIRVNTVIWVAPSA